MNHVLGNLLLGTALSAAPAMADGAELAMKEASDSGLLLDSATVSSVCGDRTCTSPTTC